MRKPSRFELDRCLDAMEEAAASHTVGIVIERGKFTGTGAAVKWKGRHFIVTADHVVNTTNPEDLYFFFKPSGTLERRAPQDMPQNALIPARIRKKISIHKYCPSESHDVAVLCVAESVSQENDVTFCDLSESDKGPSLGKGVLFLGYPEDIHYVHKSGAKMAFLNISTSEVARPRTHLNDFNPRSMFLFQYHDATEGRDPHGFSGGGVWFRKGRTGRGNVWHPNIGLGGIIIGYYARPRLLSALRIGIVRRFLDDVVKGSP